jgi:hypothetical protein
MTDEVSLNKKKSRLRKILGLTNFNLSRARLFAIKFEVDFIEIIFVIFRLFDISKQKNL